MTLLDRGDRVGDRLVVDRPLGEGAFAEVYRVRHDFLGRQAMKLFKRVTSWEETHELLGEARLLTTLGHPNIIRVFDAGTVETPRGLRGFFTMEYVAGGSLERLVAAYRPAVPTAPAVEVTEQIASGLAVAHAHDPPIVHRDLTLANVLVGYDGDGMRVRIGDFGLAKHVDPFTRRAGAQGTYAFMAPEVLRGGGSSCASDVWAVGVIGYLLLTNHFPYHDGGPFVPHSTARFRTRLPPPSHYNDDVDAELDRIVLAALEPDPDRRTATAGLLAEALRERRAARAADPTRARRAPRDDGPERVVRPPSDRARRLVDQALALSRVPGDLYRAADLLEEAVNLSPTLRHAHLHRLTLWRRGVTM
ncbi:serine/threonine-protein kinase [Streptomyces macrosporus]|uniref:non-specific serine/threonine protein kinase n=1 Tax=Streptomyces macrosporus TaxID=44032 RepID=A0ABN3JI71_9ACTN